MPKRTNYDIHISDVQAFDRCRREWDYSSPLRQGLAPLLKNNALIIGSAVHKGLELRVRGLSAIAAITTFDTDYIEPLRPQLNPDQNAQVTQDLALAYQLLKAYDIWQKYDKGPLADRNFDFIFPEQKFRVPFVGNSRRKTYLAGTFDGIVLHKPSGKYYLWEIKTTRSISERLKMLDFDQQTRAYLLAAQEAFDQPIAGIVYTFLRKKLPEQPKELQRGGLSKQVLTAGYPNTTAAVYAQTVKEYFEGEIPPEYEAPLSTLLQYPNAFQDRQLINIEPAELERFKTQLGLKALEMTNPRVSIYYQPGYHCNYCAFRAPCLLRQAQGAAVEASYLANNYGPNTHYLEESVADDS